MTVLQLDRVGLRRGGRQVLAEVSATFAPGRLTVVIGPNGAGKSSLLAVAAGLIAADTGSVRIDGTAIGSIGARVLARRRAYLPQSPHIEWPIPVERVVALGLTPQLPAFGRLAPQWQERIDRALDEHDLLRLRGRPATELSGGELARVMLARATVGDPALLIVDEPTAGLDPRHAIDAARALRALADAGRTVVAALHDLALALRIADDAIALRDGRVLAEGRAADVFTDGVLERLYDVPVRVCGRDVCFLD